MNSFYTEQELSRMEFKQIGKNCLISKKVSLYSPSTISIGNNVRIDDYSILSGDISIGSNIHISAYVALYGKYGIVLEDFTGISPRCTIFSAVDDFEGDFLIGPIHPKECTNVTGGKVIIHSYSQIGANSIVFPNVEIGEGCAIGAFSMVRHSLKEWGIYYGIPVERVKERNKGLLEYIYK